MRRIFWGLMFALLAGHVHGHQLSTAYLQVEVSETGALNGEWQVKLFDLEQAIGLDRNTDGNLLWSELQQKSFGVQEYLSKGLSFSRNDQACTLALSTDWTISEHFNEGYLVVPLRGQCPLNGELTLRYAAFFEHNSDHKLLANITSNQASGLDESTKSVERNLPDATAEHRVLSEQQPEVVFTLKSGNVWLTVQEFLVEGVIHIWIGLDHILFLLSLLLTCVLVRVHGEWKGRQSKRAILTTTAWVVTAFTLAHSLTLTATALGWFAIPSRWVEVGIAASVAVAALNNIWPVAVRLGWLTFGFGLLHGMGFAGVLGELGLPSDQKLITILAFNLGVEVGQLVIVLLVLPLLILVRNRFWYSRYFLPCASLAIVFVALRWVLERL